MPLGISKFPFSILSGISSDISEISLLILQRFPSRISPRLLSGISTEIPPGFHKHYSMVGGGVKLVLSKVMSSVSSMEKRDVGCRNNFSMVFSLKLFREPEHFTRHLLGCFFPSGIPLRVLGTQIDFPNCSWFIRDSSRSCFWDSP